jgi:signal transduction histidine kinase/DNA-binding response OmpR family regulator
MNFNPVLELFLENKNFLDEIILQLKNYFRTDKIFLFDVNLIEQNYSIMVDGGFEFDVKILFSKTTDLNCIKIIDNNFAYVFLHMIRTPTLFPLLKKKPSTNIRSASVGGTNEVSNISYETVDINYFVKLITPLLLNYRQKLNQVSLGTTLMSNISHEIRTPLNGIITTGKLLSETPLNELQRDYMNIISSSCVQLLGLVNDILDISKLENNKLVLNETSFSLRETIEECMEMTRDKIFDKNLDINLFINSKRDIIMNDKRRLMQIMINLIYNAIKFTERGNIIINVDIVDSKIIITVKDTGIGISEINRCKLFKPFTQLDTSSSKLYEGTGLGLAISKKLANKMSGDLILEWSELGKGSLFKLDLPFKPGILDTTIEDYSALKGMKCLVVDDNETNRIHIAKILGEVGIIFTLASSGQETLVIYGNRLHEFDYYIIDIRMPHMNGNILIEKLYRICPKPCISLNSGIDTPSNIFNTNLQKPIIRKKLLKSLKPIITKDTSMEFIPSVQTPKGISILVAEDNKINQEVIARVLTSINITNFTIVNNGLKAYQHYQEKPNDYDLILLDIRMPVLNGLESAKLIISYYEGNKTAIRRTPKIVGLSANCMADDKKLCMDNGMLDYLTKPLEISDLQSCISKFCSN